MEREILVFVLFVLLSVVKSLLYDLANLFVRMSVDMAFMVICFHFLHRKTK